MIAQPLPLWACEVTSQTNPAQRARLEMEAFQPGEKKLTARINPGPAITTAAQVDLAMLSDAALQVLKSEITAGVLSACKNFPMEKGLTITLSALFGWEGQQPAISQLPSIAFAVAGSLITCHAIGRENMLTAPRGGHGWDCTLFEQIR